MSEVLSTYLSAMPTKNKQAATATHSMTRRNRSVKRTTAGRKGGKITLARKTFKAGELWGALPDMGKWAFPLLKELRDE